MTQILISTNTVPYHMSHTPHNTCTLSQINDLLITCMIPTGTIPSSVTNTTAVLSHSNSHWSLSLSSLFWIRHWLCSVHSSRIPFESIYQKLIKTLCQAECRMYKITSHPCFRRSRIRSRIRRSLRVALCRVVSRRLAPPEPPKQPHHLV